LAKVPDKAKLCYEKAATGQERLSSPWTAGKHMESAGQLAKELGLIDEAIDSYRRASELILHCGKVQPSADVLSRGARAVEDERSEIAVRMYLDACAMLEEDGREQMAFDNYRAAVNLYVKLNRFKDAAAVLVRWGQSADKCHATQSQCKAYLSAVIVHLYDEDLKQAQQCYNDCSQVNAFSRSDQGETAEKLLSAYCEGNPDEIRHVVSSSHIITHLDHTIVRLAKQLPKGDVKATSVVEPGDDELNEEDLT
jgi:tetratricopeptide (TPR) repeat protein